MKEKKYIDRLYQEKFRDFEAAPRDAVWKNIEAKLREKEKRRAVIPLWYRYAGVAAVLAFFFMIGDWILPVKTSTTVAGEEIEEPATNGAASPVFPVIPIASEESTAAVSIPSEGLSSSSKPAAAITSSENTTSEKKSRAAEETASEIGAKNAIFDTPLAVASIPLQQKKTAPKKAQAENLKPSIFDAVKTPEDTKIAGTEEKSHFELSTHATPIYYGKMGTANPLDVGFNDRRQAEITYSYGVKLALNISDKVKVRSGISRVDLGYSTNGIGYQSAAGIYAVRNVSLIKVNDTDVKMIASNVGSKNQTSSNRTQAGSFTQGNLSQKIGYIEVPLEFEVNLWQDKFGVNLIGGGSTLILEDNEVVVNTGNTSAAGKANNLNEVSFSANIGLGFDYNLSERFRLNFEPMLKYQLKTFDQPSGDVQPYFMGVYTGFSYKF
jgi:hypothetical protein